MLLFPRSRNQNQRQDLVRADNDFDLNFPLGFASPWQMMRRMQEDMDRVFGQFMVPDTTLAPLPQGHSLQGWSPHIDVSETDQEYHIEADLPGVQQEDIDIQVQDGLLTLRAQMQQRNDQQPAGQTQNGQDQAGQQTDAQGQSTNQEHVSRDQDKQVQNGAGQTIQTGDQASQTQRRYHQRERRFGYFERTMSLPTNVDEEHIQAEFKDGVLTLRLPKQAQAPQGRRIQIQSGPQTNSAGTSGAPQVKAGAANGNKEPATTGVGADKKETAMAGAPTKP